MISEIFKRCVEQTPMTVMVSRVVSFSESDSEQGLQKNKKPK
jgi:hypothetical protein